MSRSRKELLVENLELRRLLTALDPSGLLLDSPTVGATIETNRAGKIVHWSSAAEAIFGFTRAETLGMSVEILVPLERLGESQSLMQRVLDGERQVQVTTDRLRRDRTRAVVVWTLRPVRERDGSVSGIAIYADIADPRQTHRTHRRALRILTQQISAILGTLNEGLLVADLDEHVLFANQAMATIHGFEDLPSPRRWLQFLREDLILMTPSGEIVPPGEWPLQRIAHGTMPPTLELRVRVRNTSHERSVRYSGQLLEALDAQPFIVLAATDLTPPHGLRECDGRPFVPASFSEGGDEWPKGVAERALLDSVRANVAVLDGEGRIVVVNDGWRRFADENGGHANVGVGANYLETCRLAAGKDSEEAGEVYDGLRAVLRGESASFTLEYPCHSPQAQRWFCLCITPLQSTPGAPLAGALVAHIDVSDRVQSELLSAQQRRVLEITASGAPLAEAMEALVQMVERACGDLRCSILLAENGTLHDLAGARIPPEYRRAVDGIAIGEGVGSCGTAAHRRREVVVRDIATDPLWSAFRDVALRFGLRACWSTPIFDADGVVLGTFAVYYPQPRAPLLEHRRIIEMATYSASVCIALARRTGALRESERRFRQLVESIHEVFWLTDAGKQHFLYVSPAYEKIWGQPLNTLSANPSAWLEAVHPADRLRVEHAAWHQQATGEYDLEYRIRRPDGDERWIHEIASPIRDAAGRVERIAGVAEDITARKQSEAIIQQQAALLEQTSDAIVVTDLSGRITLWNRGAERIYDWPRAHAVGQSAADLVASPAADYEERRRTVIAEGQWNGELGLRKRSGEQLTIAARWTLLRDEAGQPQAILALEADITDNKLLETAYLRAQRMESIGTIAGGIAHDLNNTLAPILIAVDLLRPLLAGRDDGGIIQLLEDGVRSSADLVRHLLTFSRGSEGPRRPLDPHQLVSDVTRILRTTLLKQISIETFIADGVAFVSGNATQLHQVLLNLCINARDAMPDGGTLTISVTNASLGDAAPVDSAFASRRYVCFRVTDTGTGIPEEVRPQIFTPFFTTKGPESGTGLGLATVERIVKSHGGLIDFTSEMGRGTTFRIFLPAAVEARTTTSAENPEPLPRGKGELVLVVDDEASLREINRQVLETSGFRVLTASDVKEARAIFAGHATEIRAVITDLMMPEVSGVQLLTELRASDPDLLLIAITGLGTPERRAEAMNAGANYFLQKPYTARALLKLLCTHLAGAGKSL